MTPGPAPAWRDSAISSSARLCLRLAALATRGRQSSAFASRAEENTRCPKLSRPARRAPSSMPSKSSPVISFEPWRLEGERRHEPRDSDDLLVLGEVAETARQREDGRFAGQEPRRAQLGRVDQKVERRGAEPLRNPIAENPLRVEGTRPEQPILVREHRSIGPRGVWERARRSTALASSHVPRASSGKTLVASSGRPSEPGSGRSGRGTPRP